MNTRKIVSSKWFRPFSDFIWKDHPFARFYWFTIIGVSLVFRPRNHINCVWGKMVAFCFCISDIIDIRWNTDHNVHIRFHFSSIKWYSKPVPLRIILLDYQRDRNMYRPVLFSDPRCHFLVHYNHIFNQFLTMLCPNVPCHFQTLHAPFLEADTIPTPT